MKTKKPYSKFLKFELIEKIQELEANGINDEDLDTLQEFRNLQDELKIQSELANHGGNEWHKSEVIRLTQLIVEL